MLIRNTSTHYGVVTKLLHWTIAMSIIGLIALGWYMVDLTYFDKWYNQSLSIHKALGMTVIACAIVYLIWKFISPSPASQIMGWQRSAATAMHHLLALMMIAIPLTGYVISTSAGKDVSIFGWFDVPSVLPRNESIRDLAIELHFYLAYGAGLLIIGHAAAALKHQLINKDGTLARILWR